MWKLQPRQRELIKHLMNGLVLKEAATKMGIAHPTAKCYAMRARRKLKCRTTEEMMFKLGVEAAMGPG